MGKLGNVAYNIGTSLNQVVPVQSHLPLSGVDIYDGVIGLIGFFWIKIIKFCNLHLHGCVSMIH